MSDQEDEKSNLSTNCISQTIECLGVWSTCLQALFWTGRQPLNNPAVSEVKRGSSLLLCCWKGYFCFEISIMQKYFNHGQILVLLDFCIFLDTKEAPPKWRHQRLSGGLQGVQHWWKLSVQCDQRGDLRWCSWKPCPGQPKEIHPIWSRSASQQQCRDGAVFHGGACNHTGGRWAQKDAITPAQPLLQTLKNRLLQHNPPTCNDDSWKLQCKMTRIS